jgi:hypothetical protein
MSKFKDILKAAKEREADIREISSTQESGAVEVELEEDGVALVAETTEMPSGAVPPQKRSHEEEEIYSQPPKRGRPKGKRSDPDYEQVTAYIKKETYRQTKIALLQQGEVQDFSLLVEQLLAEWLREQNSKNVTSSRDLSRAS